MTSDNKGLLLLLLLLLDHSSLQCPVQEPHIEVPQIWMRVPSGAKPVRKEVLLQRNAPGRGCHENHEFGKPGLGGLVQRDQKDLLLILPDPDLA